MKRNQVSSRVLLFGLLLLAGHTMAQAQATRTWVSGVGDDVNPCSRTAPCKTFAGAISKTAAGGVINVLDPGAYGTLTITKSITVDASGHFAGVLATGGISGFTINAAATDVVVLRGLTIDGNGTGANGVRLLSAAALHIENCVITSFAQKGISAVPTVTSFLFVKDTVVRNNLAGGALNGGGIHLKPGVGGSLKSILDGVRIERNIFGLQAETNTETTVRNSIIATNSGIGVNALTPGGNVQINMDESVVTNNFSHGVQASGVNAFVRLSNVTITNNLGTGVLPTASGQVKSFGNNRISGNAPNGSVTLPLLPQV